MTLTALPNAERGRRKLQLEPDRPIELAAQQRIPGSFQLVLALYVILIGTLPTIVQAIAFGVEGGSGSEFAAAMASGLTHDILLLLPIIIVGRHPLGILHPLLIAVLLWPLLTHVPNVVDTWGGWAGVLSGSPVDPPHFFALPSRSPSTIWAAIAKTNLIKIVSLACTYAGFFLLRGKQAVRRANVHMPSVASVRTIMLALIGVSILVLIIFLRARGGLNEHLTSLGGGRFKELSGYGPALMLVQMGTVAIYIWAAASPDEIRKPLFIAVLVAVCGALFISNGSRGGALEIPLMVGIIWGLRSRKIPWKTALILLPFMFLAVGFLGAIRTASWSGSTAAETIQESTWAGALERSKLEAAARNAASADEAVVERGLEVSGGHLLGISYAAAFTSVIPRPLWPDKPRGVGQMFARLFYGASLSGTSIPVRPEIEMYWNFGMPGVVLLSILYGALLHLAYQIYSRWYPNPFATVLYMLFLTAFHFSSDRVVQLEQRSVLVVVCYFIVAMFAPRRDVVSDVARAQLAIRQRRSQTAPS